MAEYRSCKGGITGGWFATPSHLGVLQRPESLLYIDSSRVSDDGQCHEVVSILNLSRTPDYRAFKVARVGVVVSPRAPAHWTGGPQDPEVQRHSLGDG